MVIEQAKHFSISSGSRKNVSSILGKNDLLILHSKAGETLNPLSAVALPTVPGSKV